MSLTEEVFQELIIRSSAKEVLREEYNNIKIKAEVLYLKNRFNKINNYNTVFN